MLTEEGFWLQEHHEFNRGLSEKIQGIYYFHKKAYEGELQTKGRKRGWFRGAQALLPQGEGSSVSPQLSAYGSPPRKTQFSQFKRLATLRDGSIREMMSGRDIFSGRQIPSIRDMTGGPMMRPAAGGSPVSPDWMSIGEVSVSRIAMVGEAGEPAGTVDSKESLDLKIQKLLKQTTERISSVTESFTEQKSLLIRVSSKIENLQQRCLDLMQNSKTKVPNTGNLELNSLGVLKADPDLPQTAIPEKSAEIKRAAPIYLTDKILLFEEPKVTLPEKFLSATQNSPVSREPSTPIGKLSSTVTPSCQKEPKSGNWIVLCDGSPIMLSSSSPHGKKSALIQQRVEHTLQHKQHRSMRPESRNNMLPPLHERMTEQELDLELGDADSGK